MAHFADRIEPANDSRKLTTADINNFSKAFVSSLKDSGLDSSMQRGLVEEFLPHFPTFIHHAGNGAPHTVEQMKRRVETVRESVMERLKNHDSGNEETNAALVSHIGKAFETATARLAEKPAESHAPGLTIESVTAFGDMLFDKVKKALPVQHAATETLAQLARRMSAFVTAEGNLPETPQAMQAMVAAQKDRVIARVQSAFADAPSASEMHSSLDKAFQNASDSLTREPRLIRR